ncbi:MAG: hypothetical protein AVDCRST_MAG43-785 [uncultured Thermomicrobiales bacterium]|uniref:Zinc finger CHC2-type domain-containing protein n=1 Tax=uncultured Thermomicrobiales bacterium TaxID=1645740 RepID=A0A6J4UGQ5_9BACT|nr:MAG: hypothetical protein AVDCRST_MAG43-785 [uncultured Thermomicrobiales bacterium]
MSALPLHDRQQLRAYSLTGRGVPQSQSVNLYRAAPTADVLAAIEYWSWWLAELSTDSTDPDIQASSLAFAQFHLSEAVSELERRKRLRAQPTAPPWPKGWRSALPDAQRVKDHLDLLAYYRLLGIVPERAGPHWIVPCDLPSHPGPDMHPSLRITGNGRGWYCFPCALGGDLLTLHCARTGLPFRDALAELAAEAGLIQHQERFHGDRD